jgi:hypothetical protein
MHLRWDKSRIRFSVKGRRLFGMGMGYNRLADLLKSFQAREKVQK